MHRDRANQPSSGYVCVPIGPCRQDRASIGTFGNMLKSIDPKAWYTAREAADLLNGEVTEATLKEYCKQGKLKSKRRGPKKRWVILGLSIKGLRQEWELD